MRVAMRPTAIVREATIAIDAYFRGHVIMAWRTQWECRIQIQFPTIPHFSIIRL
jgi:hypothetical protein